MRILDAILKDPGQVRRPHVPIFEKSRKSLRLRFSVNTPSTEICKSFFALRLLEPFKKMSRICSPHLNHL